MSASSEKDIKIDVFDAWASAAIKGGGNHRAFSRLIGDLERLAAMAPTTDYRGAIDNAIARLRVHLATLGPPDDGSERYP